MTSVFYTKEHEWLQVDNDVARVGITDHAQAALGEIVYVELPELGRRIEKGEAVCVVESVKSASDVYSPLSGEVVEVNTALDDTPEMVNAAAEADAWFFKVRIDETIDSSEFMAQADYLKLLQE